MNWHIVRLAVTSKYNSVQSTTQDKKLVTSSDCLKTNYESLI